MKATQSRVGLNEMLGSLQDVIIQAALWLCSAISGSTQLFGDGEAPNARINPPGDTEPSIRVDG